MERFSALLFLITAVISGHGYLTRARGYHNRIDRAVRTFRNENEKKEINLFHKMNHMKSIRQTIRDLNLDEDMMSDMPMKWLNSYGGRTGDERATFRDLKTAQSVLKLLDLLMEANGKSREP